MTISERELPAGGGYQLFAQLYRGGGNTDWRNHAILGSTNCVNSLMTSNFNSRIIANFLRRLSWEVHPSVGGFYFEEVFLQPSPYCNAYA